jgi:hypothetical protein
MVFDQRWHFLRGKGEINVEILRMFHFTIYFSEFLLCSRILFQSNFLTPKIYFRNLFLNHEKGFGKSLINWRIYSQFISGLPKYIQ